MILVNVRVSEQQMREVEEMGHRLVLFSITKKVDARGSPIYQAIASGDCPGALSGVAMLHVDRDSCDREEEVEGYVIYDFEEVKKGMKLGRQEQRAGDN